MVSDIGFRKLEIGNRNREGTKIFQQKREYEFSTSEISEIANVANNDHFENESFLLVLV